MPSYKPNYYDSTIMLWNLGRREVITFVLCCLSYGRISTSFIFWISKLVIGTSDNFSIPSHFQTANFYDVQHTHFLFYFQIICILISVFFPSDPVKRAQAKCWQAWEQTMQAMELSTLVETEVLAKFLQRK